MALRQAATKYGTYVGLPSNYSFVSVFRGIAFAKPPVGELRWKAPQPLDVPQDPESITIPCYEFPKIAIQDIIPRNVPGPGKEGYGYEEETSEDCLYLNIWTPADSPDEKLPVMLWIHGGGYFGGQSNAPNINGDVFGKKGCVTVSIAYRLGIFGFLAHPELNAENPQGISGNYGMLDQVAALNWVYENIAAFGGDPEKIMLFGQSAGSMSSQILASSPLSKHMVNRVICESGVSMDNCEILPVRTLEQAQELGVTVMREMGVSSIAEARAIEPNKLQQMSNQVMFEKLHITLNDLIFAPVIDGNLLTESLGQAAACGDCADVEYIFGHTQEGLLDMPMKMDEYGPWLDTFGAQRDAIAAALACNTEEELAQKNPGMFRGRLLTASYAFGVARAAKGTKPAYYYFFNQELPGDDFGACHSAELFYVFDCLQNNWRPYSGVDYEIAEAMATYWTNFAKTGNPNGDTVPEWKPFDPANPQRMVFREGMELQPVELESWRAPLVDYALGKNA